MLVKYTSHRWGKHIPLRFAGNIDSTPPAFQPMMASLALVSMSRSLCICGEILRASGVEDFGVFGDGGATIMAMGTDGVGHSGSKMGLADLPGVYCLMPSIRTLSADMAITRHGL